jgi:hypothetical protein
VDEWLDTYNSYIKLYPSQNKETTQIAALCYSNVVIYREGGDPVWSTRGLKQLVTYLAEVRINRSSRRSV